MTSGDNALRRRQEALRRAFRPVDVRLLFVGESPPASGRFFYLGDSGLYRAMRDAFLATDASVSDGNFLSVFQAAGCYLVDLCPAPVDRMESKSRRAACAAGEKALAKSIARMQPAMIVTLLRSIEDNVARSAAHAGWHGPVLHLPYPGRWSRSRNAFVDALAPVVRQLRRLPAEADHFEVPCPSTMA